MKFEKTQLYVLGLIGLLIAFGGSKIGGILATFTVFGSGVLVGYLLYKNTKNILVAVLGGALLPTLLYATDMSKDIIEFGKMSGGLLQTAIWVALGLYIVWKVLFEFKKDAVG